MPRPLEFFDAGNGWSRVQAAFVLGNWVDEGTQLNRYTFLDAFADVPGSPAYYPVLHAEWVHPVTGKALLVVTDQKQNRVRILESSGQRGVEELRLLPDKDTYPLKLNVLMWDEVSTDDERFLKEAFVYGCQLATGFAAAFGSGAIPNVS